MGAVIGISLEDLPEVLERGEQRLRRAVARGALAGAHRGRALMVKRTPVDTGQLKAGWRVKPGVSEFTGPDSTLAELVNDAPTIAFVELGSKPHAVNPEGWAAIYEWVRRHYRGGQLGGKGRMRSQQSSSGGLFAGADSVVAPFRGPDPVISQITNAIVWRIRKYGQKPTLFVRNSIDLLRGIMAAEMERAIAYVEAELSRERGG